MLAHRGVEESLHVGFLGDVADDRERPVAGSVGEGLGCLVEAAGVMVREHDGGAFLGGALGGGEPDPGPGGGGHHHNVVGEQLVAVGVRRR